MNLFRILRTTFAAIFAAFITLLFLDVTGTLHSWLGWMVKIQFLPAILALNVGVVIGLVLLTLLFGRLYCSIICPLGVFQDVMSRLNTKRNHFKYSKAVSWLRYLVLAIFIITLVAGVSAVYTLLEPYSAFGRIATNLFAPIYELGNNLLAFIAAKLNSYAFYSVDIWIKSIASLIVAAITFVIIGYLSWRHGRLYCNSICPVGTILGLLSRFAIFKIKINTDKCNGCGLCARNCKSSCIDPKTHTIDYSRCVTCFDCIDKCNRKAIGYGLKKSTKPAKEDDNKIDSTRRKALTIAGVALATSAVHSRSKKVDGGLAFIEDKKIPNRKTPISPAGSINRRSFTDHCTGCQLCISACDNGVLRPSTKLENFMQPEVSYERGYCRPECTKCSEVCPAGAIKLITREQKSSTQIGHAVWIEKNCIVNTDKVQCGNCERHCPSGAITMVNKDANNPDSLKIPIVNTERCIGCGACENLCPARPFSAIYVEGHLSHKTI